MEFAVLGPLEVTHDGELISPGTPQQQAVLAMLVIEANRVVSLERIVDQLWEDHPPSSAAGSVHSTISILRRRLEPSRDRHARSTLIQSRSPGYVLHVEPGLIDTVRFEQMAAAAVARSEGDPADRLRMLDAALAQWRGPALADFATQRWAMAAAVRLDGLRSATVAHRIDALLAAGGHLDAIADLEAMVGEDPLRERQWAQLMVALYRSGRQVDALRAFQRARGALADVGIEPGRELRDLEVKILDQSGSLDHAATVTMTMPRSAPPGDRLASKAVSTAAAHAPMGVSCVGRDRELATMCDAFDRRRPGAGIAFLISGAAGSGKSCLADALADRLVERNQLTVRGSCVEGGIAPGLWPWINVASAVGAAGNAFAESLTAGSSTDTVSRAHAYRAALEALAAAAARRPLTVVIEDVHWADPASHHLLQLIVSSLATTDITLIVTSRPANTPGADTGQLSTTLAGFSRSPLATRVDVPPLDADAVAALLAAHLGVPASDQAIDVLLERTGGSAFHLTEVIRRIRSAPSRPMRCSGRSRRRCAM